MKYNRTTRNITASLLMLALTFMSAAATFAATGVHLQLKNKITGKTYDAVPDASGSFTFQKIEIGNYDLACVCDDASSIPGLDGSSKDAAKIEISSFSWGVSNAGSTMVRESPSKGRLRESPTLQSTGQTTVRESPTKQSTGQTAVTSNGMSVATGDVDGDGIPDLITSPVTVSLSDGISSSSGSGGGGGGGAFYKVVLQNIMVSSVCSPSGKVKSGWNIKENTK